MLDILKYTRPVDKGTVIGKGVITGTSAEDLIAMLLTGQILGDKPLAI